MLSTNTGRAQTSTVQYIDGKPAYMSNELLISFGPTEVLTENVDNLALTEGSLSQFVKASALALIQQSTGVNLSEAPTQKIFLRMTSADSLSIARNGDTVRVFPFWATFSVRVNGGNLGELRALGDTLRSVYPTILGVSFNLVALPTGFSNDPLLRTNQYSLLPNISYSNSNIRANYAWNLETGKSTVRIGVLDGGIRWTHEDFGGGTLATSCIAGGWDYGNNRALANSPSQGSSHGTAVAGIIGARRNNARGIAGIAGGNGTAGSGVSLYDMRVDGGSTNITTVRNIAAALVEGAVGLRCLG